MERPYLQIQPYLRSGAAALALLAAGCSAAPAQEALPERQVWEATTTLPPDECAARTHDALQPFDDQGFFNQERPFVSGTFVDMMDVTYPDGKPQDFANYLINAQSEKLTKQGVKLVFDPSIGLAEWVPGDDEASADRRRQQKINLLDDLTGIIATLDDYPDGTFSKLGVTGIRLADTHAEDRVAGHFNLATGEIQFEYAANAEEGLLDSELRRTLAHELGHAVHTNWCNGYEYQDREIADGIDFLPPILPSMTDQEVMNLYEAIPAKQLAYGPDRVFPDQYSATGVGEYFASVVEYTIEDRGLIQPGDADFGSRLQENQAVIVDRLETLFPGFKAFAERQTRMLRMNPQSEIYSDVEHIVLSRAELKQKLDTAPNDLPFVLNGVVLGTNYGGRGGDLSVYPKFTSGKDSLGLWIEEWGPGSGKLMDLSNRDEAVYGKTDFIFFQMPGSTEMLVPRGTTDPYPQTLGFELKQVWSGDAAADELMQHLLAQGATPKLVEFTD